MAPLAAGILLSSCGGSGGGAVPPLSKPDYIREATAICRSAQAQLHPLLSKLENGRATRAKLLATLNRIVALMSTSTGNLQALPISPADAGKLRVAYANMRAGVADVRQVVHIASQMADLNNPTTGQAAELTKLDSNMTKNAAAAGRVLDAFGISACDPRRLWELNGQGTSNAHNPAAESDLGNAIIEAAAMYTQDAGEFGASAATIAHELTQGETSFAYVLAATVTKENVVGVEAFDCSPDRGLTVSASDTQCQGILMWTLEASTSTCYAVIELKTAFAGPAIVVDGASLTTPGTYYADAHATTKPPSCGAGVPVPANWKRDGFPALPGASTGPSGSSGNSGSTGNSGSSGNSGSTGNSGSSGSSGNTGPTGSSGTWPSGSSGGNSGGVPTTRPRVTASESDLGNAIIEATAVYTMDNGAFGQSAKSFAGELQQGETSFTYTSTSPARTVNVVLAGAADCSSAGANCQVAELASYDPTAGICYYVISDKDAAFRGALMGDMLTQPGTFYASARTASGCSLSDTPSNWQTNGGFPSP